MSPSRTPASLFEPGERAFIEAAAGLAFANPFTGSRVDLPRLRAQLDPLIGRLRGRLIAGAAASATDVRLYQDACLFFLTDRYADRLRGCLGRSLAQVDFYDDFAREQGWLGAPPGVALPPPAHLFACAFQMERAFHYISSSLLGGSLPAARLRAQVWESIFTHDPRRYLRTLYRRMDETATLVLGPTGTGKELVARAIGLSRYVPFDAARGSFAYDHAASFHGLNLSELAPAVIESELFGHRRGSFTGAVADKRGWLELGGTMFLDEIGEIGEDLQVKLLRVIQERIYHRVGDTEPHDLHGKIIAATHRNLVERIQEGAFRLDLYMRICADRILTPSLREMLDAAPGERRILVRHIAEKVAGREEADQLTDEVEAWIDAKLPADYPWPGNVRELEQCVRRRMVHHSCRPIEIASVTARPADNDTRPEADPDDEVFARAFREGTLTAQDVLRRYTTIVHAQTGSARETARRLGVDRRVVARTIDHALLARLVARRGTDEGDGDGEGKG